MSEFGYVRILTKGTYESGEHVVIAEVVHLKLKNLQLGEGGGGKVKV